MARVRIPTENRPFSGWPTFLFLHGCGECGDAYAAHAEEAAEHGFAALAPSGPVATRGGGRAWPADGFAATNEYLEEIMAHCEGRDEIDQARVFLCGFSQGATHAVGLLASRPERYQGALALSPGEGPPIPRSLKSAICRRPLYLVYGQNEYPAFRKKAQRCAVLWQRARWPCLMETHPGAHHFPGDWKMRFPTVLQWLASTTRELDPKCTSP